MLHEANGSGLCLEDLQLLLEDFDQQDSKMCFQNVCFSSEIVYFAAISKTALLK